MGPVGCETNLSFNEIESSQSICNDVIEASIPIIANATPEDKSLNVYYHL